MNPIAIVGAGITGLTAAYELKKRGVPVRVFEAGPRAGGVIRTAARDGFIAECGPNTLLETSPKITELVREIGLEPIYSSEEAKKRYVVRNGKLVPLPGSPWQFARTELFSFQAKWQLLREPFVAAGPPDVEESLAQFVVRRLGHEFLDYAINPFVAGVYAGDPWKLSVREAFGKVYDLEQKYGSLIKGQILGARERKKRGTVSKQSARKLSFRVGLEELPATLARRIGGDLKLNRKLETLRETPAGWRASFTEGASEEKPFSAVLLASPAYVLPQLEVQAAGFGGFGFLKKVAYAPICSFVFGFRREQVAHPLDGFGFLVPEVEKRNILGAIFSSSLFPNRAPNGFVTITCYLGGLRAPELVGAELKRRSELALADLRDLLGVTGPPVFSHQTTYSQGIPQYELGYGAIREQINRCEQDCPGLFIGGNFRDGVSVSDSILNGIKLAERIAGFVQHRPQLEQWAA